MINVLFVCLGNICRSPMAEAVFRDMVTREGLANQFHIASVGTGSYHVGELVYPGTRRVLAEHGIECHSIARQMTSSDLAETDYVIAMDRHNQSDISYRASRESLDGRLHLLLDFAAGVPVHDVPDPYYTGDYEEVYRLVDAGCRGLLEHIRREHGI